MRKLAPIVVASLAAAAALAASPSGAAPKPTAEASEYGRDLISVITAGRHAAFPTATCIVWANAEGLGVGVAQLGGYHGVNLNLNEHPLAGEPATTFAQAMAEAKAKYPTAPPWLLKTLEKHQAAIEAACQQDHADPFKIYAIGKKDMAG